MRLHGEETTKGAKIGDLLLTDEQVVEGLDAVLVLHEDLRHASIGEEGYPLPARFYYACHEAFDLGDS